MKLNVALGADQGGFTLKKKLYASSQERYQIVDLGTYKFNPTDGYTDFSRAVAQAVASGQVERGVFVCGSGVGACIAANKVPGVRACL